MISTQISPDVAALVTRLIDSKPGDEIAYHQLSKVVGRDVAKTDRWLIQRAIEVAARDHGAIFGNIRGVGYQRLSADQAHMLGATSRTSIRRKAKRTIKRIVSAVSRVNQMNPEAARKANAEISTLGVLEHISRDKVAAPAATHDDAPEPVAIAMQRMLRNMGAR